MPLTLYLDGKGKTVPASHGWIPPATNGWKPSGNDRATRLVDVALAWNVFQHFYPYFDVVRTDWPAALREVLEKGIEVVSARSPLAIGTCSI